MEGVMNSLKKRDKFIVVFFFIKKKKMILNERGYYDW
jgi:hypothetical protein